MADTARVRRIERCTWGRYTSPPTAYCGSPGCRLGSRSSFGWHSVGGTGQQTGDAVTGLTLASTAGCVTMSPSPATTFSSVAPSLEKFGNRCWQRLVTNVDNNDIIILMSHSLKFKVFCKCCIKVTFLREYIKNCC